MVNKLIRYVKNVNEIPRTEHKLPKSIFQVNSLD